jgi:hypothetical protein
MSLHAILTRNLHQVASWWQVACVNFEISTTVIDGDVGIGDEVQIEKF